jgi:cytochrome c biogenesis protein CcmG/thiol:disulfide interchange protein DsbE
MRDVEMLHLRRVARDMRGPRPPTPAARRMLAGGLVVLVSVLGPLAASQPAVTDLLGGLNLTGYPPGTKPPQFAGHTVEDQAVSLAGLRGRVILLTFWATWCQECRLEMPVFERLHRDFAAQELIVMGVNVREERQTIQRYADELDLTFPLVLDPKGKIIASYGVIGLPTTFLIGRDGRPVAHAIGPRHWDAAPTRAIIQALLAEPEVQKNEP